MPIETGFTLIELMIVIIILGILAATALPRFINLRTESILASMHGLESAMDTAMTLAHAKATINGITKEANASILVNGETVDMAYGYPAGTANGIAKLIATPANDWKQRASSLGGAWVYWHGIMNEDAGATECYIRYRASTDGKRPIVNVVQTGCATAQ